MKTINVTLYNYDELNDKAKKRALEDHRKGDNAPFLTDDLRENIYEELKDRGYTVDGIATSDKPTIRPMYSLSHSQGDGLMFEATVIDKDGNRYTIKHNGRYAHERSTDISGVDDEGNELDQNDIDAFEESIYIPICKTVRDRGYDELEYADSEEAFMESCEANGYTFEANGVMRNE